jgi:hypothetical protein
MPAFKAAVSDGAQLGGGAHRRGAEASEASPGRGGGGCAETAETTGRRRWRGAEQPSRRRRPRLQIPQAILRHSPPAVEEQLTPTTNDLVSQSPANNAAIMQQ